MLFEIFSDRNESPNVDAYVFEALVYLVDLVTREFQNFRPVLDLYIKVIKFQKTYQKYYSIFWIFFPSLVLKNNFKIIFTFGPVVKIDQVDR